MGKRFKSIFNFVDVATAFNRIVRDFSADDFIEDIDSRFSMNAQVFQFSKPHKMMKVNRIENYAQVGFLRFMSDSDSVFNIEQRLESLCTGKKFVHISPTKKPVARTGLKLGIFFRLPPTPGWGGCTTPTESSAQQGFLVRCRASSLGRTHVLSATSFNISHE